MAPVASPDELVLEAARRRASELLEQAYKYENLGFPETRDETYQLHAKPLLDAIRVLEARRGEGPTPEDVLKHELVEAVRLAEFLHDCLTDPHIEGVPGGSTYAYPEHTRPRLDRWLRMAAGAPACSAEMFSSKHPPGPCPVHDSAFQELRAAMESLPEEEAE